MRRTLKYLIIALLSIPLLAHAQDAAKTNASFTYQPEGCEFALTFPEKPHTSKQCDAGDTRCYDLVTFTKVYGIDSSVKFRVTCSAVNEDIQKKYTKEIMQATLRAMTRRSSVDEFDTTYREEENFRQAGLVGEGKSGDLPNIYIAQLWMGQKSALSMEAELVGVPHDKADALFADTLKSVHFVKLEEKPAAKKDEAEKAPAE